VFIPPCKPRKAQCQYPIGRMGIAGNICAARRRRCARTSTSSARLDLASQAPCARALVILGQAPSPHFSQGFCCGVGYGYVYSVALGRAPRHTVKYTCGALRPTPCTHTRLRRLPTKSCEKCGPDFWSAAACEKMLLLYQIFIECFGLLVA